MLLLPIAALVMLSGPDEGLGSGQCAFYDKEGKSHLMALKSTEVRGTIEGFGARVTVTQKFHNPSTVPIEAIYTFPLPDDAAVDRMQIQIGSRIIEGEIKRREEARAVYEAAKNAGQVAALLEQQTNNIFTQSVANVMPGAEIQVRISYVQILKYEAGEFEFVFPMTIGPRFLGDGTPRPSEISPPTLPPGVRSGMSIDLKLDIYPGGPITSLRSVQHKVDTRGVGQPVTYVSLNRADQIPNRDFILRYRIGGDGLQGAFVTNYTPENAGYFAFIMVPPKSVESDDISPRELIFVMDQSGSQSGFPIEKSKELTLKLIDTMNPRDTFNVMGFSNDVRPLWPESRPNTPSNVAEAKQFVQGLQASGGTELEKAVVASLSPPANPSRLRIVLFNTDGFAGQQPVILDAVKRYRQNGRLFTFGIGSSVNRDLINAMSVEGRGDSEVVTLRETADAAVERFVRRLRRPVLTDIQLRIDGVTVTDMSPSNIPDVFEQKPIVVLGRFEAAAPARVTVTGSLAGKPFSRTYPVAFAATERRDSAVNALWARKKIAELESRDYYATTSGKPSELSQQITQVALDHGIMSQFTSFVAVEKRIVNVGGRQRTVRVPIEMPEGVTMGYERKLLMGAPVIATPGGVGGGGFGGGGLGGAVGASPVRRVNPGINVVHADATKSRVLQSPKDKIDKELQKAKGKLEVQILLLEVTDENLAKLKELGLTIDETDKTLKVVFGTVDAAKLAKIAELEFVHRISPIE